MDPKLITQQYNESTDFFETFQNEIYTVLESVRVQHKNAIDIDEVRQRPDNRIKSLQAILENCRREDKYKKIKSIYEIKDIAGVRITCLCLDDYTQLDPIIEAALKERFDNLLRESKGDTAHEQEGKSNPSYRAIHYTFSKKAVVNGENVNLIGEVQLRTVMANAWAILDRKYVYGSFDTGESTELTNGASAIMEGCEKIWSVIKKRKKGKEGESGPPFITPDLTFVDESKKIITSISQKPTNENSVQIWIKQNQNEARKGITNNKIPGYMEVKMYPMSKQGKSFSSSQIKEIARKSQIHTFGWPIGVYLDREDSAPIVDPKGIHAEIAIKEFQKMYGDTDSKVYDYWALTKEGYFYTISSLFEDTRAENTIFFNTRIIRVTEVLMYARNLYSQMEFEPETSLSISIAHGGLSNRTLSATRDRFMLGNYKYRHSDPVFGTKQEVTLRELDENTTEIVANFCNPLFEMFDGFEIEPKILEPIVLNYKAGKVS